MNNAPHDRSLEHKHAKLEAAVLFVDPTFVRVGIGGKIITLTNEQFRVAQIT